MGSQKLKSSSGPRSTRRLWFGAMQVIGLMLLVIGVAAAANRAQAEEAFLLDKYPGLGRSPAAAVRDDTIAAWEVFRREQLIASCMGRSGFEYAPTLSFPPQALAAVAKNLSVTRSGSATASAPSDRNDAYVATLSGEQRERYYRALFAESEKDMTVLRQTGRIPDSRGNGFARGGCAGEANSAVPSVWTLKQELELEFDNVRRNIAASSEIASTGAVYAECSQQVAGISARSPRDLDKLAASDSSRAEAIASVGRECSAVWASGYRNAEVAELKRFERRNADALLAAQQRYSDAMTTISADQAFLDYLAQYAFAP